MRPSFCQSPVLVLTFLLTSAAISSDRSDNESTPLAVVEKMYRAVREGNHDEFRASVIIREKDEALFTALVEFQSIGLAFRERLIEAYGQDGLEQFHRGVGVFVFYSYTPTLDKMYPCFDDAIVTRQNGRASVALPDHPKPFQLVEHDGRWRVDLTDILEKADAQDLRLAVDLYERLTSILRRNMNAIGQEDVTVDKLSRRVGREYHVAVGEARREHGTDDHGRH